MRSVERRSFSCAFIAAVRSLRICSLKVAMATVLYTRGAMSLDIRALLEETGALLTGHFRLSSGLHSPNYVQCARLLEVPRNARAVGEALAGRLAESADRVVAPALGGVIIGYAVAEAMGLPFVFTERKDGQMTLRRGFVIRPSERVILVEDVVTTGKSTRETTAVIEEQGG